MTWLPTVKKIALRDFVCAVLQFNIIRGVTKNVVVQELHDLCPLKGTTTGKDIFGEVRRAVFSDRKLCGLTADGARSMTGKRSRFLTLMLKLLRYIALFGSTCGCEQLKIIANRWTFN